MSGEVAIVAGTGGALGHAAAATLAVGGRTVVAAGRNEHPLNHRDPVTAFHLAGGKPEPIAKRARPPGDVLRDPREIP